jgi:murein DD-endopeptidase MepM/ murein hydrolase activator NlpD
MKAAIDRKHLFWLPILIMWLVQLACATSGVDPGDPRLHAPISNIGMQFGEFLNQLNGIPRGGIMAPWITKPGDVTYVDSQRIEIEGWAAYFSEARVVIYDVEPDTLLTKVVQINEELMFAYVNQVSNEWKADLMIKEGQRYLAARLELRNGKVSPFSNIIFISTGQPESLSITTPRDNEVVFSDKVSLQGTGIPRIHLDVFVNGEKMQKTTQIGPGGNWRIDDVPLLVSGFDGNGMSNAFDVRVKAAATNQDANVIVRKTEYISLLWPFGTGEGENYAPNFSVGQISSFFHNDWHQYDLNNTHPAIDIATGSNQKIHSVADGVVSGVGTWVGQRGQNWGNYVIVDSGEWGTLYLHIVENASNSLVKVGDSVKAGQIIATEGKSGTTNIHLHISVCVWETNSYRASPSAFKLQNGINLNPPIKYQNFFNNKNIELYDWWGGSAFCDPNGCWRDLDWEKVAMRQSKPTEKYANGCLKDGVWQGGPSDSPYTTRRIYCEANPTKCRCD